LTVDLVDQSLMFDHGFMERKGIVQLKQPFNPILSKYIAI
jgi:hypothetical protein